MSYDQAVLEQTKIDHIWGLHMHLHAKKAGGHVACEWKDFYYLMQTTLRVNSASPMRCLKPKRIRAQPGAPRRLVHRPLLLHQRPNDLSKILRRHNALLGDLPGLVIFYPNHYLTTSPSVVCPPALLSHGLPWLPILTAVTLCGGYSSI
ncbi:hypothetical protein KCU74_g52, partial [Aureobasidium melanogenum]